MPKRLLLIFLLLLPSAVLFSQDLPETEDEELIREYTDELSYLSSHPVNLNHAGLDQLLMLPGITAYQALRIGDYLKQNPNLSQPEMLVRDSVLDQSGFDAILPYLCIDGTLAAKKPLVKAALKAKRSWPLAEEMASGDQVNSPWDFREKVTTNIFLNYEVFVQAQKDPGEGSLKDFYSANLFYNPLHGRYSWVAGDFSSRIGQGLILGGGGRSIVSAGWTQANLKQAQLIKPYHSGSESAFLRGLAGQTELPYDLTLLALFSHKRIDAKLDSLGHIAGIYTDGYHRDSSEYANKNKSSERIAAVRLGWKPDQPIEIGATVCHTSYSPNLNDSLFFRANAGVDVRLMFPGLWLAAEMAGSTAGQTAANAALGFRSGPAESYFAYYRYGEGYKAPRFGAMEYYSGRDEQGAVISSTVKVPFKNKFSGLGYLFHPLSAGAEVAKGQGGYLLEFAAENDIIKDLKLSWRWRQKGKYEIHSSDGENDFEALAVKTSYKLSLAWDINRKHTFYGHYQQAGYRIPLLQTRERGECFDLGLKYKAGRNISLLGQSVLFNTQGYDARLYASEPELLNDASFHGYWGRGRRDAVVLRYGFGKWAKLDLKAAREIRDYENETTRKTEVGMQLEVMIP
ncbi:helix-hairpin-helix domain-containing protein [candidate division TA06 bacterium]|nr:helix-hairpin-helix domain-containing protein [candidate division TA06 bacterium]